MIGVAGLESMLIFFMPPEDFDIDQHEYQHLNGLVIQVDLLPF